MFNAVCEYGHIFVVTEGSDLASLCQKYREEGQTGTIVIQSSECRDCDEEHGVHLRQLAQMDPGTLSAQGD